jgi:hypothetical protein
VLGGRLVQRWGRLLTATGLSGVVLGLGTTAVVLLLAPPAAAGWAIAVPMLLAGLGAGSSAPRT